MAGRVDHDSEFLNAFSALAADFAAGLDERVTAMRNAVDGMETSKAEDHLDTLRKLAHKLAGSAGTFGFPAIGDGAEALESACIDLEEDGGTNEATRRTLHKLVEEIAALVDANPAPDFGPNPETTATSTEKPKNGAGHVLLVEDDPHQSGAYLAYLEDTPFTVTHADTGRKAIKALKRSAPDAVLLDLSLPDMDGLEILGHIAENGLPCEVIVITARSSVASVVEAMRLGAFDYLIKPFDAERLRVTLRNALERRDLSREVEVLRGMERDSFAGFIGSSPPMQAIYRIIDAATRTKATVFITGESGTGKELCARAIHDRSSRAGRPFVALNCGAIPRDLMESEIFGHVKGAFTGALSDRPGAAARADGGTLFLDEIGELDLGLQTKLLRFLQTGTIQKVGGSRDETVDVRIVCATNRDPLAEVAAGRFREDLFYRLHVVPIHMPPLRERPEDILTLARHFLARHTKEEGKAFVRFSPEAERFLRANAWPGNVRQLENLIRSVVVLNDGEEVTPDMLPENLARNMAPVPAPAVPAPAPDPGALIRPLAEVEREAIEHALELCGGDVAKAAHYLDIHASTIYRKKASWEGR